MDSAGGLLVLEGIIRPGACVLGTDVVYYISTFLVLSLMDSAGGLLVLDGIIRPGVCVTSSRIIDSMNNFPYK
jgi:hypothetical protein